MRARPASSVIVVVAGTAAAAATLLASTPAHACASCACGDDTITAFGAEKPFPGRLRLALSGAWRVTSEGAFAEHRARVDDVTATAAAAFAPTSWLVLGAALPLTGKRMSAPDAGDVFAAGTGDLALHVRGVVLTDGRVVPRHMLALTGSAYLPTTLIARDAAQKPLVDEVQPGYGALAADAGVFYAYLQAPFALFTSARGYAALSPGALAMTPGPALFVDATGQWQPVERVAVQLGLDGRAALAGASPQGPFGDGVVAFASAGTVYRATDDVVLSVIARVPVWEMLPIWIHEGSAIEVSVAADL